MNQIGLVGRITKDPQIKMLADDRKLTNFVLAVTRTFKNSDGNVEADFLYCVAGGRLADIIVKHCGKGSLVGVNGRIQTRSYMNRDNQKVYTTEIIVEDLRFYALKPPALEGSTTETQDGIPPIPADFILPEEESVPTQEKPQHV